MASTFSTIEDNMLKAHLQIARKGYDTNKHSQAMARHYKTTAIHQDKTYRYSKFRTRQLAFVEFCYRI